MASYAYIEKDDGKEVKRLCATNTSSLRLVTGESKMASAIVVEDVLKIFDFTLRVDQIDAV